MGVGPKLADRQQGLKCITSVIMNLHKISIQVRLNEIPLNNILKFTIWSGEDQSKIIWDPPYYAILIWILNGKPLSKLLMKREIIWLVFLLRRKLGSRLSIDIIWFNSVILFLFLCQPTSFTWKKYLKKRLDFWVSTKFLEK